MTASVTDDPGQRVRAIAAQLREIETRLAETRSSGVEASLLERAAELADEAVRLLESFGRGDPGGR